MDEKLNDILKNAKWDELTPKLINYADWRLRRCRWRGEPVEEGLRGQLLADGKSAGLRLQWFESTPAHSSVNLMNTGIWGD